MFTQLPRVVRSLASSRLFVRAASSKALVFSQFGEPSNVLKLTETNLANPAASEVLIKFLAAPINPADINVIQGVYGSLPNLPAVAGSEGVAVVEAVGSSVKGLKVGDRVIPSRPGFGTWRTRALATEKDLTVISSDIAPELAASISVNPVTAHQLLKEANLKSGDVIIQNGANSQVGQSVIQLAHLNGIKTINVIRQRADFEQVVERLKLIGADIVVTDEYLRTPEFKRLTSDLPAPSLAINSVGGRNATDIARTLGDGGKMVTIGGMSKKPVQIPTSLLIFKNISLSGFWLSRWVEKASPAERKATLDSLSQLVRTNKLQFRVSKQKFANYQQALEANASQRDSKVVLVFDE